MISDWRGERRIGPAPLPERLWDHSRGLAYAFLAASILTPFSLWIKLGWPPETSPTGWIFVWCGMFSLMMLHAIWPYATAGLWRHVLALILAAVGIVALVARFAEPAYTAIVCMQSTCIVPKP
jgi:hypothetical protein